MPGDQATDGHLRGVIDLMEHLGADAYASVKVGDDVYVARVSPDTPLAEDQPVALTINVEKIHLFDGATGSALLV
jgi:ABC-type sugar transport system ATPase subunit